jgi:hypothetical protein
MVRERNESLENEEQDMDRSGTDSHTYISMNTAQLCLQVTQQGSSLHVIASYDGDRHIQEQDGLSQDITCRESIGTSIGAIREHKEMSGSQDFDRFIL